MKHTLKALRPAASVAAAILAGALLASCSSGVDGEAASDNAATTSANETTDGGAPDDGDTEAQITQAADDYLTAVSSGEVALQRAAFCKPLADSIPEGTPDSLPIEPKIVLDTVENIVVEGKTATADVTASLEDTPDEAPQTETITFVYEDSWKFCQ